MLASIDLQNHISIILVRLPRTLINHTEHNTRPANFKEQKKEANNQLAGFDHLLNQMQIQHKQEPDPEISIKRKDPFFRALSCQVRKLIHWSRAIALGVNIENCQGEYLMLGFIIQTGRLFMEASHSAQLDNSLHIICLAGARNEILHMGAAHFTIQVISEGHQQWS